MLNVFRGLLDKVKEEFCIAAATPKHNSILTEPQLMSVALMLVVSHADFETAEQEAAMTLHYLKSELGLNDTQATQAFEEAQQLADNSVSLHEFTSKLKTLDYDDRVSLLGSLWQIAYADKILDPNEEAMLRKIADLLFIRHSDYIQCKLSAAPSKAS
ncbi:TerB family tellurite resistance protein [Chromatiaceae bacterium AAb-1]|nr:TerB family tellurite resistance protein [Chromatiaceae bacterium AAb-1]